MLFHSGCACVFATRFQPICGTFNSVVAAASSGVCLKASEKNSTLSGNKPKQSTPPLSFECDIMPCMPTHIPSKGFVFATSRITWSRPRARTSPMQSPIAPTPGYTTRSAFLMISGSSPTQTLLFGEICCRALETEWRFPIP